MGGTREGRRRSLSRGEILSGGLLRRRRGGGGRAYIPRDSAGGREREDEGSDRKSVVQMAGVKGERETGRERPCGRSRLRRGGCGDAMYSLNESTHAPLREAASEMWPGCSTPRPASIERHWAEKGKGGGQVREKKGAGGGLIFEYGVRLIAGRGGRTLNTTHHILAEDVGRNGLSNALVTPDGSSTCRGRCFLRRHSCRCR